MVPLERIKLHLDSLRQNKAQIRVHGNGFIQIDATPNHRINVWSGTIPAQQTYTGIHDHRFDFVSSVWYGTMHNVRYNPIIVDRHRMPADAQYRVYQSVPSNRFEGDEDTKLEPTESWIVGRMYPELNVVQQGQSYFLPRFHLHETRVKGLTITSMYRFTSDPDYKPRVLVKINEQPSNEFDKHGLTSENVWSIVFGLLNEEIRKNRPRK